MRQFNRYVAMALTLVTTSSAVTQNFSTRIERAGSTSSSGSSFSSSSSSGTNVVDDVTKLSHAELRALLLRHEQQFELVLTREELQSQQLLAVKEQLDSLNDRLTQRNSY